MTDLVPTTDISLTDHLASAGYWPAIAARRLQLGKYSDAVGICRENLEREPQLLSGRLICARASFLSGQTESAAAQFRRVLAADPDNIVALKYLGDIAFEMGDLAAAMANYGRVLELDPACSGLKSDVRRRSQATTRTITLTRRAEPKPDPDAESLREIPFYTETIGDIYLAQGYPRLAAQVYRKLSEQGESPRLAEKLSLSESKIKEKDN
jgi:tetratricopeptide (TPR) repeat protein